MAITRYRKKQLTYNAIQYDGDVQALRDQGIKISEDKWKDIHVQIFLKNGNDIACPIGHYILKSEVDDIEVLSPDEFEMKYEVI